MLYECVACSSTNYPAQPMQQGGGKVCPDCKPGRGAGGPMMPQPCAKHARTAPPSAPAGLDPSIEQQRDMLARAIRDAAVKAGIARADADMTGPMLLMLCDDMADCILAQQPAAVDEARVVETIRKALHHSYGAGHTDYVNFTEALDFLATQHQEPTT